MALTDSPGTRVGIYLRISLDMTHEGLGVSRQREDCLDLAKQLGWHVVEIYTDNEMSATSSKTRPGYRRMLADVDAGKLDAIIAWHADRLYRRVTDLGDLVDVCKRNNTQIATVRMGHVDLTTPTGRLVAGLLAQVSMYEVEHKSERWSRSWRQAREAGAPARTGSRLFGYTRDMQVIPEEAELARRMAADIVAGGSIQGVARWLEEEGVLATRGNDWRPSGVRVYLTNPRLAGWSTLKGEIVAEGQWEPILDRDTWETLKALLEARTRAAPPRVALLGGLIFCGSCGHRLITSGYHRKAAGGTERTRTYRCPDRPGLRGCGKVSGIAAAIEEAVEGLAKRRLSDPRVRRRVEQLRESSSAVGALEQANALEDRLIELEAELDVPGVPVSAISRAIDRTKQRLEELRVAIGDAAEIQAVTIPTGGAPWPEDLAERRRLILVALGSRRVYLKPRTPGWSNGKGFDAKRVVITTPSKAGF